MLIECSRCNAKVNAEVLGSSEEWDKQTQEPCRYSLTKCPVCRSSLLAHQYGYLGQESESWEWDKAKRVWPDPDNFLDRSIPTEIRRSLEEARRCYKARAFAACAVMCGRAIEAICHQHTNEKTLFKGLEALKDAEIIDGRLLEWADSLRHERNLGAHASGTTTTSSDARDLLDFATAICDYVYVLTTKYNEYKKRKATSP